MTMQTNAAELESAATFIGTIRDELSAELANLRVQIDATSSVWKGWSAVTFINVMARYDEATKKLHTSLTEISDQVRGNATGYRSAEEEAQSQISAAGNLLQID